jgi:hypothetical protein
LKLQCVQISALFDSTDEIICNNQANGYISQIIKAITHSNVDTVRLQDRKTDDIAFTQLLDYAMGYWDRLDWADESGCRMGPYFLNTGIRVAEPMCGLMQDSGRILYNYMKL